MAAETHLSEHVKNIYIKNSLNFHNIQLSTA